MKNKDLNKSNILLVQCSRRLKSQVESLKTLVGDLKNKDLISSKCEEYLSERFSGVSLGIFKSDFKSLKTGTSYDPVVKGFALTLQFYSSKVMVV